MRRAFGVGSNQETGLALGVAGVNPGQTLPETPFEAMFSLAVRFLDGTSHREFRFVLFSGNTTTKGGASSLDWREV